MSSPPCTIPANSEVSGIGIRIGIYVQNLLGFIPALTALWDGEVSKHELEAVEMQSTTILITAFAILISSMVQAQTPAWSSFHANVILSLSWMSNTNTFIYFLLYLQYRSQLGRRQVRTDLFFMWKRVQAWFCCRDIPVDRRETSNRKVPQKKRSNSTTSTEFYEPSLLSAIFRVKVSGAVAIAILGSLHLSLMSALGIWLWHNPRSFGSAKDADACAVDFSSYIILGQHIPLKSNALRIVSLVIYGAFITPGFNLLLPIVVFLGMLGVFRALHGRRHADKFDPSREKNQRAQDSKTSLPKGLFERSRLALVAWYNPFLFPAFAGLVVLLATNIVFVIDLELMLRDNQYLRSTGESEWTFAQTLAILTLVLPLRDLRIFGARKNFTSLLRNAIRGKEDTELLRDLVRSGANVNVKVEGPIYSTVLLLAASDRRDKEFTRMLLVYGADPNVKDRTDCTALYTACSNEDLPMVNILLSGGADPDVEGGESHTALQAAAGSGNLQIVQTLLDNGADVNIEGGRYGTALEAALAHGHTEIVQLLRASGATRRAASTWP
ncbi:Multiple ankyrin repeats single kh domain [Mycena sanguinolenta]|uniref:Multiple ankyrin repeats single kh domain n=1 Tax=Mycena sanguinolenta TaxID=230812 RepID=A0A8H6YII4_9AGAR|nr:Multiple ankyrin repeats single kh domain [Mycena sanguinolenta]